MRKNYGYCTAIRKAKKDNASVFLLLDASTEVTGSRQAAGPQGLKVACKQCLITGPRYD